MFAMTDEAIDAIKKVAPGESGLRLSATDAAADDREQALHIAVADEPLHGDLVVDVYGVRVFLEPTAAALVDDKVLDATVEGNSVRFALAEVG
jgi:iron-sulfur cluster assembly protein